MDTFTADVRVHEHSAPYNQGNLEIGKDRLACQIQIEIAILDLRKMN